MKSIASQIKALLYIDYQARRLLHYQRQQYVVDNNFDPRFIWHQTLQRTQVILYQNADAALLAELGNDGPEDLYY